jgi:hypothetical protein
LRGEKENREEPGGNLINTTTYVDAADNDGIFIRRLTKKRRSGQAGEVRKVTMSVLSRVVFLARSLRLMEGGALERSFVDERYVLEI